VEGEVCPPIVTGVHHANGIRGKIPLFIVLFQRGEVRLETWNVRGSHKYFKRLNVLTKGNYNMLTVLDLALNIASLNITLHVDLIC
jgi:hypothetical protein